MPPESAVSLAPAGEERTWIEAAQRGDKAAFGHIVQRYHRLVVSIAYRLSGDPDLADDVAQDTFLRAWQHLPRFRPQRDGSLRTWLSRIAHNRTIDLLRRSRPQAELSHQQPDPDPSLLSQVLAKETSILVQGAILHLPEPARMTLILREFEGMSYAEIAAVLDIPIGTVMSRLHNARRRLMQELAPILYAKSDP